MRLSPRQEQILKIVKREEPITSHQLAERLNVTRSALRPDLTLLTLVQILHAKPKVGYSYNPDNNRVLLQKTLIETKVAEIQSTPIAVKESTNINNAAITIFLENVESLFVVCQKGFIKGYVTAKDLLKVMLGGNDVLKLPISVAMNSLSPSQCLQGHATLFEALHILTNSGHNAIAVIEENKLIGRITPDDVIRFLLTKAQIKID